MKKRYSEEQIIGFLRDGEAGIAVKDLWAVNVKRVRRLYRLENLMVRRRKRKKVPLGERQPLLRPSRRNEVWSIDFVFDRLADGRSLKCLTVVDDCTLRRS